MTYIDPVEASPDNYKAVFENEHVRVLEMTVKPGEYYVTEIPCMLRDRGDRVELVDAVPPEDVLSINTPQQLAEEEAILNRRIHAMEARTGS